MHIYTQTSIHRQKISAMTPQRVKQYHRHTYASIYMCMHIHINMHIHICAHPAANVSQMSTLMSKEHLYNARIDAQALVPRTPVQKCTQHSLQKECTYIYTYTHCSMHTHTYAQESTCASMTPPKHARKRLLRLKIYAQMCIHIHMHMYMHACVYPYIS